jgi:hypothetical protein
MYTCCVDVNPKICPTNNVSVKICCLNVNNLHVHDFTWHDNHLFTFTCATLIGTKLLGGVLTSTKNNDEHFLNRNFM